MPLNCTTDDYDFLYAPWLKEPGKLLDMAGWEPTETLLDLAGGTGAVAKEAVRRCRDGKAGPPTDPHICLLDPNPRVQHEAYYLQWVEQKTGLAERVEDYYAEGTFDVITCRQAVGYINMVYAIPGIYKVLSSGGRFAFNTFGKPSLAGFRTYQHVTYLPAERSFFHRRFVEFHLRLFGHVFHMQARLSEGVGVDFSWFKYYRPAYLVALLLPWFKVEVTKKGNSYYFVCTKGPHA